MALGWRPVVMPKCAGRWPWDYDRRLKRFPMSATRYVKIEAIFLAFTHLASSSHGGPLVLFERCELGGMSLYAAGIGLEPAPLGIGV